MNMSHARKEYRDFMTLAPEAYEAVLALGKVAAAAGIKNADFRTATFKTLGHIKPADYFEDEEPS